MDFPVGDFPGGTNQGGASMGRGVFLVHFIEIPLAKIGFLRVGVHKQVLPTKHLLVQSQWKYYKRCQIYSKC